MDGKLVFKNAVTRMPEVINHLLERNKLKAKDIDFVIAHQANLRINEMVMKQLDLPLDKTHNTLDRYGNTTMATIPITFDEALQKGKIKRGDKIVFVAFGAGFTWGANLIQF
jgi:3-oxoacyl-[acyl-carrier-protein] synthase III